MADSEVHPLTFRPVEGWPESQVHRPVWDALARETGSWLPFQEPLWSELWWRQWGRRSSLCERRFVLWVGSDEAGRVRALLPSVMSHRPGAGPLQVRILSAIGPDRNVTELQPILCRPEDEAAAHAGLLRALRERRRTWDAFRWLSVPGAVADRVRAEPGVEHVRDTPDHVIALGTDWEAFRAGLPRKLKDHLRKAYNNPARDGVELEFVVLEGEDETRAALPDFLRLYSERALTTPAGRQAYVNAFSTREATRFLSELVSEFSRAGALRILTLRHGSRTVASRLAFRARDTLYLYHSGFDREYARYSVGTRNLFEGLKWACGRGVRCVNLSTGTDTSKTRWRPSVVPYVRLWQWAPTARGRLARILARIARRD